MAKLKIVIDNASDLGPVFEIDPARFAAAAARHPDLHERIAASFTTDCIGFAEAASDAEVVIGWSFPHRELGRLAPRLRWVHLTGAGVNHKAPFDWIPAGVVVTNSRGVHAPKAEEFGALAALMLNCRMPEILTLQTRHSWALTYSPSIVGRTAGIVGVGNMGGAVAAGCKKLAMRVLGLRRGGGAHPAVDRMSGPEGLDPLLAESDIVFLCTPLTGETRKLMGAAQFARMKRGAGLVNMARGGVIDDGALIAALASGQLAGAILDVFEPEPLPASSPLWRMPGVIITPHCSSDDARDYVPRMLDLIFANIRRLLAGEDLSARVNPALGY